MLIHASEVAACIGRNPYRSRAEMLRVVLKRYDAAAFQEGGFVVQSDVDACAVATARAADPAIDAAVAGAEAAGSRVCVAEVHGLIVAAQAAATQSAAPSITPLVRTLVERHCRNEAFCQFGTAHEADAMRGLELTVGTLLKDDRYAKRRVDGPVAVYVGGRVDGFATPPPAITGPDRPTVLVEIKNRMHKLFKRVVDYERVQVLCYMHIFERRCAKLVERMGDEVAVHDIPFDHVGWEEIASALQDFAREVISMTHSGVETRTFTS